MPSFIMPKGENMDLIKRPKKVQRAEKGYLTNEKYQDFAESQFKTIYDKVDEITGVIDSGYQGEQGPVGPPGPQGPQGPERTRRTKRRKRRIGKSSFNRFCNRLDK